MGKDVREEEIIRQRRSAYLRTTSYLMTGIGLAFGVLLTSVAGWQLGLILFAFGVLCPLAPLLMKEGRSIEPAAHFFMFLFIASMSAVAWRTGGLDSPAIYALVVGSPMSVLILSARGSIFWVVIAVAQLALFGILQFQGFEMEQLLSEAANQNMTALSVVAIVLVFHLLLLQYQGAFAEQAKAVSLSEARIAEARIEAVAAHEDFDSAALVASGDDGDLLARMRHESEIGLAALDQASEQIEGMFAAMTEIEPRVGELKIRSEQISEHLETIERVSTKLDLMAVNAALEAARAGLHGVTFGPIAQDMRRLAESATVEINAIRSGINGVSTESEAVREVAIRSVQSASQSKEQIAHLHKTFHGVLEIFEQTTKAAGRAQRLGRKQLDSILHLLDADSERSSDARRSSSD